MSQPSRQHILALLILGSAACLITAVPLPQPANGNSELDVLQIPLANGKEIDVLTLGAKDQESLIADRNKRTIGLLRELFPDITKQIDEQANRIISKLLRTLGPTVLRTAIQGNSANAARTSFDADFDDDDDESSKSSSTSSSSSSGSLGGDGDADGDSTRNADGYTEGIPGPVTRLVVLANRGLANLVQDLILRVAATSEKFVNFKAKLITALI
ncbi:uncharacterized protein Dere_GG18334, isoform B [Drosophila erecta]|uniref:Uncharacterized protein, isoform B n=1 Tax=Drosophila erecta TaxID=7220 RepID=A0A0Q5TG74_DROER|nr:uncharacterized protein Dere_GG18334, isoform B [Drosophila erecta]